MNTFLSKYLIWYPAFYSRGQKVWSSLERYKRSQYYDYEHIKSAQFEHFKEIFTFAYNNISFYKKKYDAARIHPNDLNSFGDIAKIPILTKQEIIENGDEVYNNKYSARKFKRSTSGSTGSPLIFYKDAQSMEIMDAVLYRNYLWFGIDIGNRQVRFWGHPLNRFGYFKLMLQNRIINRLQLSPFHLSKDTYEIYLNKIEKFKPQYIYGYAQTIYQFSNYFFEKQHDLSYLNLKAVILTGEMIFPHQIETITNVFKSRVSEEYGCTEVGIIAFKCESGNMHLMENLLVEEVCDAAENSANILLVSELYGGLFPFIRYKLGDRGNISYEKCACGRQMHILRNLSGRKDDFIVCPDDKKVDPYIFEYFIKDMPHKYGEVYQFKMIQKDKHSLEIFLVVRGDTNNIRKYFLSQYSAYLHRDMQIEIKFVPFLQKDRSGKLRCFISEL